LINYWPDDKGASAARVDVESGAMHVVVNAKPSVLNWFSDHLGRVRAGEGGRRGETTWTVYGRTNDEDPFEELAKYDRVAGEGFTFAGFDPDPNKLYVYAPTASGRIGLFPYDIARKELGPALYSDPVFDVGALVLLEAHGKAARR
jgi:hypothetical protein